MCQLVHVVFSCLAVLGDVVELALVGRHGQFKQGLGLERLHELVVSLTHRQERIVGKRLIHRASLSSPHCQ